MILEANWTKRSQLKCQEQQSVGKALEVWNPGSTQATRGLMVVRLNPPSSLAFYFFLLSKKKKKEGNSEVTLICHVFVEIIDNSNVIGYISNTKYFYFYITKMFINTSKQFTCRESFFSAFKQTITKEYFMLAFLCP